MRRLLLLTFLSGFLALGAQNQGPQVSIYPNPASSQVNIAFSDPVKSDVVVTISDILGNKIETLRFTPDAAITIDLVALSLKNGIYLVKIESAEVSSLKRLVIKS